MLTEGPTTDPKCTLNISSERKKCFWPLFMDEVRLSLSNRDSLLFTTKSPGVPVTHLTNFRRMIESILGPPSGYEPGNPRL